MKNKKDFKENYFGGYSNVHIYAKYLDGKFYDLSSDEEIVLENDSIVRMTAATMSLKDINYERYTSNIQKTIIRSGNVIYMKVTMKDGNNYILSLGLITDLNMTKRKNKFAQVDKDLQFEAFKLEDEMGKEVYNFEPFKENSLNQAYFQISLKYRPEAKSHTTNIYKSCFDENGNTLEKYRF